jgi:hypothetical protein
LGIGYSGRAKRRDRNHQTIIQALRGCFLGVVDLAPLGDGVPDLLVSDGTDMWLFEVKAGIKEKMTPRELEWWGRWPGKRPWVICSTEDALRIMGKIK